MNKKVKEKNINTDKMVDKKKKTVEKTKCNKSTRVLFIVALLFLLLLFVNNIIMYYSESYAYFFVRYIYNPLNGILFYICSYLPYFSYVFFFLELLFIIVLFVLEIYYETFSKKSIEVRNKRINLLYKLDILVVVILVMPIITSSYTTHVPLLDKMMFEEKVNKEYKRKDLLNLNYYLEAKVLSSMNNLDRNNGKVVFNDNYNKLVVNNLKNVSSSIPLLNGLYPARSYNLNNYLKGMVGSDVVGLTHKHNTYFDYNMDSVSIINTMTHEYCHSKGIVRENEAVFCSFLAGIESDNEIARYSSYLEAFGRANYALYEVDPLRAEELMDGLSRNCLYNGYDEICNIYVKNSDEYIKGANKLYIKTYFLKNYASHRRELEDSLKILIQNGAIIKVDDEVVTIEEVLKKVDSVSNKRLTITIDDFNKEKFESIKDAIRNDKLYLSIYQENYKSEESEDKKDIEAFYLAPFKDDGDSLFYSYDVTNLDYTYERVVRLLLEYYDTNGYK